MLGIDIALDDIYLYSVQVNGDQDQTDGPHPKCCPLYLKEILSCP